MVWRREETVKATSRAATPHNKKALRTKLVGGPQSEMAELLYGLAICSTAVGSGRRPKPTPNAAKPAAIQSAAPLDMIGVRACTGAEPDGTLASQPGSFLWDPVQSFLLLRSGSGRRSRQIEDRRPKQPFRQQPAPKAYLAGCRRSCCQRRRRLPLCRHSSEQLLGHPPDRSRRAAKKQTTLEARLHVVKPRHALNQDDFAARKQFAAELVPKHHA